MNEWSKVKKVIIGTATNAFYPRDLGYGVRHVYYADQTLDTALPQGKYSEEIINEMNEDLDNLAKIYQTFGAEVLRLKSTQSQQCHSFVSPRDNVTTIGDYVIASPMSVNTRKDEWKNFPVNITHNLTGQIFEKKDYVDDCIGNKNYLATQNYKPMWDAANVLRAGRNILYLLSNTGNLAGAVQLQELLGEKTKFKVHVLQGVYSYQHIDTTLALLEPGKVLINPSRIKSKDQLPKPMKNWDMIVAPEPADLPWYGQHCMASLWGNVNIVSLDEKTKIVDKDQIETIKTLEQHKYTIIPVNMKHTRSFGAGPHCATLEVEREAELDWYFDA